MKQAIVVEHVSIEVQSNFNDFTFQLETALGIMTPSSFSPTAHVHERGIQQPVLPVAQPGEEFITSLINS